MNFVPISPIERSIKSAARSASRFLLEQAQTPMSFSSQTVSTVSRHLAKFYATNRILGGLTEDQSVDAIRKQLDESSSSNEKVPDEVMSALFGSAWKQVLDDSRSFPDSSWATQRWMASLDPQAELVQSQAAIDSNFALADALTKELDDFEQEEIANEQEDEQ